MKGPPRLVALSPGDLEHGGTRPFLERVAAALEVGLPGVLLREPGLNERAFLALATTLATLRTSRSFWFAVHDRAHFVRSVGADGLHLSFRSLPVREARQVVGPDVALGLSTHAADDARSWDGADYLFHGPLHETPSKVGRLAPLGLEGLARVLARTSLPVLALGGVGPADCAPLRACGLYGAAVRAGLLGAADPVQATRAYLEGLT